MNDTIFMKVDMVKLQKMYEKLEAEIKQIKLLKEDSDNNYNKIWNENAELKEKLMFSNEAIEQINREYAKLNDEIKRADVYSASAYRQLEELKSRWESHLKWLNDRMNAAIEVRYIFKHIQELETEMVKK
jgi:chromosome segregation ATPase